MEIHGVPGGAGSGHAAVIDPRMHGADGVILIEETGGAKVVLTAEEGEYIVPEGVDEIAVHTIAGGGGASDDQPGYDGEYTKARMVVKPGDRFHFKVGRGGAGGINGVRGKPGGDTVFEPIAPPASS